MKTKYFSEVEYLREKIKPQHANQYEHVSFGFPFFFNHRGSLIHRIRSSYWHLNGNGIRRHQTVTYFCGNYGHVDRGEILAVPPDGRLVCERCEALAIAAGAMSSTELVGRHVHTGRMVPLRTCCKSNKN